MDDLIFREPVDQYARLPEVIREEWAT